MGKVHDPAFVFNTLTAESQPPIGSNTSLPSNKEGYIYIPYILFQTAPTIDKLTDYKKYRRKISIETIFNL